MADAAAIKTPKTKQYHRTRVFSFKRRLTSWRLEEKKTCSCVGDAVVFLRFRLTALGLPAPQTSGRAPTRPIPL